MNFEVWDRDSPDLIISTCSCDRISGGDGKFFMRKCSVLLYAHRIIGNILFRSKRRRLNIYWWLICLKTYSMYSFSTLISKHFFIINSKFLIIFS